MGELISYGFKTYYKATAIKIVAEKWSDLQNRMGSPETIINRSLAMEQRQSYTSGAGTIRHPHATKKNLNIKSSQKYLHMTGIDKGLLSKQYNERLKLNNKT